MKKKIFSFIIILIVTIVVLYLSLKDNYETIVNTILGINKLDGAYLRAANVNNDSGNVVNGTDSLMIKKHILGLYSIKQ